MSEKEITLHFDMEDEVQNRVYYALKNLPEFFNEPDLSKAVILFVNNMVNSIGECEERTVRCEEVLKSLVGPQAAGKIKWQ